MKTVAPEIKYEGMSVYEVMRFVGVDGFDICDNIWDWGTYLGCNMEAKSLEDESMDWYDKFCWLVCVNLECCQYREHGYTECKVADFIRSHQEAWERFCNEENAEEYRPEYWLEQGEEINPDEDGLWYDIYMNTFESLLVGNYSDSDYEKICKYLIEYDEKKEKEEK